MLSASSEHRAELSGDDGDIFYNQDLRSSALELPDIADINLTEFLNDIDGDEDGNDAPWWNCANIGDLAITKCMETNRRVLSFHPFHIFA